MSEYQRYEFMTGERPLTSAELSAVNGLSSHIEASSGHALIEYHWGDFKHDPIDVLYKYFDGFLYWANWGSPRLALRFPHGILSSDLIDSYDLEDFIVFTKRRNYDILDIHFGEMESPPEWVEYELGPLMALRDELMEGDQRVLYILWLAVQNFTGGYDDDEDEGEVIGIPPAIPPGLRKLSEAQQALAELVRVPQELLAAAARHSTATQPSSSDDFAAWVQLLPPERRDDYLVRLAGSEPGLSRLLVKELRELGRDKGQTAAPSGERITYTKLLAESEAVKAQMAREQYERDERAHREHLQSIHDHQDTFWWQADKAVVRGTSVGYDDAVQALTELRDAAAYFQESQEFQTRFLTWVEPHLRRPAFVKRLQTQKFVLP